MNMQSLDWWVIVIGMTALCGVAYISQRQTKSVADFLAANRCANRYLLTTACAMLTIDASTVIAMFQTYYEAGFTATWWVQIQVPVSLFVALSGWVVYRWRQTRILSQAQLFELRYSKRYRIFIGILSFVAGVGGAGILPAIAANFLIYFLGLPTRLPVWGFMVGTFPLLSGILVLIALTFTLFGGQITILITNFFQGTVCNIVFLLIFVSILWVVDWNTMMEGAALAPQHASLINPFKTSETLDYGPLYYVIGAFFILFIYPVGGWNQSSNASAKNAHEARMAGVLGGIRGIIFWFVLVLMPVCAYMVMHHPDYAEAAARITQSFSGESTQVQRQVVVPAALAHILPKGIAGAFAVAMMMAFISTHDNYLLMFGGIFIQDVILPFRKTPFSPRTHMRLLRFSVVLVAALIFLTGVLFQQKDDIQMFWSLLASLTAGALAVPMLGALYWSRGTTLGCWAAAFTGIAGSLAGFAVRYVDEGFFLNGQQISLLVILTSAVVYVAVSLLERKPPFDMDRLLHRGKYALKEEHATEYVVQSRWLRMLGVNNEFSNSDKFLYLGIMGWSIFWFVVFLLGSAWHLLLGISDVAWTSYWWFSTWLTLILGTIVTLWLTVAGVRDALDLFRTLRSVKRNDLDDGMVMEDHPL